METNKPLVSICCITYNHAPFIRKAIEGFLMQKTNFPIEILIHDDCSTDGTTEIVREYAEMYPDVIKPLYETENQYPKVGTAGIDMFNYGRAQGKYIAYCEGDDYWTDPLKLQKQVDWMETHDEYSVCFHTFRNYKVVTGEYRESDATQLLRSAGNPEGLDIDLDTYFKKWYTQPMTMLIRRDMFDLTWRNQYKYYRDMHEIYHLIKVGKCRLMNFDGGVRNVHEGGIASMISLKNHIDVGVEISKELYQNNKSKETKDYYIRNLQWKIYNTTRKNRLMDSLSLFLLDLNLVQLIRNFKRR